jgi:N-acyl-phosphatidylethanolamine-hydrolysing phospholipase D
MVAHMRPVAFPWKARKNGRRFRNIEIDYVPGLLTVARWKLGLGPSALTAAENCAVKPFVVNVVPPNLEAIHCPPSGAIVATWLGHATFLLQIGDRNYLTDPIFGANCSPLPLRRFERKSPLGIAIKDLPRIDGVLVSHDHYDHLDRVSLLSLGPDIKIFCPVGVGSLLRRWGLESVHEFSWGEFAQDAEVRITSLPTQHGSGRSLFDRNCTLWCGWLAEHAGRKVVFLGDTGYASFFRELGSHIGPIDLALIPIGAYRPGWFMRPLHLNPVEATQMHLDLCALRSIAMHWGTFALADDPLNEPPRLLREAISAANIAEDAFRIPDVGETCVL